MTPELCSIKGHTWAELVEESGDSRVTVIVYDRGARYSPERYFLEYRGPLSVERFRGVGREELIRQVADAAFEERIEIPEGFDIDDAIDGCELLLFGRVVSR